MSATGLRPPAVLDRLLAAMNSHDPEAMVACFAADYLSQAPAHPLREFRGNDQVRRNWGQIYATVHNLTAEVLQSSFDGSRLWTEWDIRGTRTDGVPFAMSGVMILGIADDTITSARLYLEPVEESSGDVESQVRRLTTSQSDAQA